jgi:hypothetical protein
MQAGQCSNNFEMTELLSADVHQQVFAGWVLAVETLNGILHCGGQFTIGASELLEEHVAELGIWLVDSNRVHELFDVMVHRVTFGLAF